MSEIVAITAIVALVAIVAIVFGMRFSGRLKGTSIAMHVDDPKGRKM